MSYNVEPTAEVIDNMVEELIYRAERLSSIAVKLRESSNFEYVAEAIQEITNTNSNLRLDLLITRPLRETMK